MAQPDQQVALALAIKNLKENMPALLELDQLEAKRIANRFEALQKQGFSKEEAFEMVRARYAAGN